MSFVKYEQEGAVAILTIERPEALNALNSQVLSDLDEAISKVEAADDVFAVILTGAGRSFVAGADIGEMVNFSARDGKKFGVHGGGVFLRLENMSKPVIAAVNGFALGGGCELAMSCDIRLASEKAKFGQPEVGLGITPGFGGTQRLPRIVGMANAIAANAQIAVRESKAAIRRGMQTDMNTGVAFEAEAFGICFSTEDQKDAMKAFVNKEKLNGFKNK